MKSLLSFLAVSLLCAAAASADWVIETKIESPQLNSNATMKIKGEKLRMDIESGPVGAMSMMMDTASGDSIQILHAQKMAVKTSAAQTKQAMDAITKQSGAKAGPGPIPTATGQIEKIGDYDCEIYTVNDGKTTTRLWVAKNHPLAAGLKAVEKQMRKGFLAGTNGGPDTSNLPGPALKTEVTTAQGKTTSTILSVKEQPVADGDFEIPQGYQTLAMPTLPGAN
jgi:hypothetical protein